LLREDKRALLSDARLFVVLVLALDRGGVHCCLGLSFFGLVLDVYCWGGVLVVHNSPQTSSVGVLGDLSFLKMLLMDDFFIVLSFG
jgi:hypothetical protein